MIFILFNYFYDLYYKKKKYNSLNEIVIITRNNYLYNYNDNNNRIYKIV